MLRRAVTLALLTCGAAFHAYPAAPRRRLAAYAPRARSREISEGMATPRQRREPTLVEVAEPGEVAARIAKRLRVYMRKAPAASFDEQPHPRRARERGARARETRRRACLYVPSPSPPGEWA